MKIVLKIGPGNVKILQKYDFTDLSSYYRITSVEEKKVKNMQNLVKFIISPVFFVRLTSIFYHKKALIFNLSVLHTIRHKHLYEILQIYETISNAFVIE